MDGECVIARRAGRRVRRYCLNPTGEESCYRKKADSVSIGYATTDKEKEFEAAM